jgi:Phage integrase family
VRAGNEDFCWHDLRHTWASWLIQNGTPLYDLQEMSGWKSTEMVRRYVHLAPAEMAQHAAVVGAMLAADHDTTGTRYANQISRKNKKSSYDCS